MLRTFVISGIALLLIMKVNHVAATSISGTDKITTRCEFYNETMCRESKENGGHQQGCNEVEECEPPGDGKRSHCYVLWRKNESGNVNISLKGCFLNNEDCYNKTQCVERTHKPKKDYMFCCCEGNMCNQRFVWDPAPTEAPPVKTIDPKQLPEDNMPNMIIIAVAVILFAILTAAVALYLKGKKRFHQVPTMEPHSLPSKTSSPTSLMPIQLEEIKARGRFGAVWKARHKQETIAVKVFPIQDKQSWLSEQEIYKLPYMDHANILHFINVESRGNNLQTEFWLITEYHERGSLCDYLKAHTLTWTELCHIARSMTRGLTHLHDVYGKSPSELSKPAIAHRDFKSKNVLLKNDLTACIADFGLALIFHSGKSCGDTHGQVGTRRYMAPEVLEGAINFTSDAFLRIDMYACGLVLWELVARCIAKGEPVPEYHLPFEDEVGPHPTLEDMQEAVVQRKVRPNIPSAWRQHSGLSGICDTMEECWDHDAEARLSASCVMERILMFSRYPQGTLTLHIENESPVKENSA